MAVNHNVNPRPLTAEEKEKRARGIYDSFATYVVFCGHCRYVRKTNMYIMRAEAFIDELRPAARSVPTAENRSGRSATRWARPPASSSSDGAHRSRPPQLSGGLFFSPCSGTFAHHLLYIAPNGKFCFPARVHMLS